MAIKCKKRDYIIYDKGNQSRLITGLTHKHFGIHKCEYGGLHFVTCLENGLKVAAYGSQKEARLFVELVYKLMHTNDIKRELRT